ncbi:MAG: sigma 54-interacting transcriptional regulator [Tissierellia bacterium]|nr:sigma 54-interacting transcriptional regulator [Tissierellia bacterium]
MESNIQQYDFLYKTLRSLYYTVITDNEGKIILLSENYQELLGVTDEEYLGKPIRDIIPNSEIPYVLDSKKEDIGHLFTLKNGKTVVCNRIPILGDNNEIIGVISSATFFKLDEVSLLNQQIKKLQEENLNYKKQISELSSKRFSIKSVIGDSLPIMAIKETVQRFAESDLTFLITGETGTGKEVFANAVHELSKRRNENFVKINCAAIPKDLLESELFGYEPGAFSGALKEGKTGKFEHANGGTLLLDEIGEMPLSLQSKLLRVLQEGELERVGGLKAIKLDVRIICSTNQNIEELIKKGEFRRDLFYRINVVEIHIPPLRERLEDIPLFCKFFIDRINEEHGLGITSVSDDVYSLFYNYDWKGNVRELMHVLERACIMAGSGPLNIEHFDFLLSRIYRSSDPKKVNYTSSLNDITGQVEKEKIIRTLVETKGNKSAAARILKIDRSSLYNKIKKYNIDI